MVALISLSNRRMENSVILHNVIIQYDRVTACFGIMCSIYPMKMPVLEDAWLLH